MSRRSKYEKKIHLQNYIVPLAELKFLNGRIEVMSQSNWIKGRLVNFTSEAKSGIKAQDFSLR